jgi:hypothetical protein
VVQGTPGRGEPSIVKEVSAVEIVVVESAADRSDPELNRHVP